MSLEARVSALEKEVATLKALVAKLTGGGAANDDDAPPLPEPEFTTSMANLAELKANNKVGVMCLASSVSFRIYSHTHPHSQYTNILLQP